VIAMQKSTPRGDPAWRDGVGYALALLAWVALSAASALTLLAVRSVIGPLTLAIGIKNPANQQRLWEIGGRAGAFDRIALVAVGVVWLVYVLLLEEYLRASISGARAQRARAVSGGAATDATDFGRLGLRTLAHRTLIAAAFPAAVLIVYLLLQGALWLVLHS
jgi:hypothetical protein